MLINNKILQQLSDNDPDLTSLDLSYCNLTLNDIRALVKSLAHNTYLKNLNISGNPIGDIGAKLLTSSQLHFTTLLAAECNISAIKSFADNTHIKELDLAGNDIGPTNASLLAENKTLRTLSLAGNNVGDNGAIALAKNCTVETLTLSHNKIGVRGGQALAKNTTLKILILNYNFIQAEGIMPFAENTSLLSLAIAGNNIATPGIIALSHNKTIRELNISYNEVNDQAITAFAQHPSLIYLNLSYNQITHIGALALQSIPLESLIISHNLLKDEGAILLAVHKTLKYLNLAGNSIGFDGGYALSKNEVLTSLTLSSNILGDVGGVILAENKTLKEIFLSYNGLGDAAAKAFSDNTTLEILNLNYNKISAKGRQLLTQKISPMVLTLSKEQPPEFTDENLDTIFLLSESFLCISNIDSTLQFFNPAFSRVLGYCDDELLAKPALDFLHPYDKEKFNKNSLDEKIPTRSYENRYRCKDNTFRTIRWSSHIKYNRQYAVGTDVTEIRNVEKAALLAQQESAMELLQEAKENSLRQTEFIAHLSHEIRNPLSGIYGLMETLKAQINQVEILVDEIHNITSPLLQAGFVTSFSGIHESLNDMIVCAEYQKAILNDNLDIVKISEKKFLLEHNPFELKKSINQVVTMLQAKAIQKGLTLNFTALKENEIWVKGDASRLKQILMNVLGNAIKFTEMGNIDLTLKIPQKNNEHTLVEIDIADTGIGLNPEELSHLFERFSHENSAIGSQYGGSGLGLYLAKQVAKAMGGDIIAKSEVGKSSTFSITVKLSTLSLQEKNEIEEKEESKNSAPSSPLHSLSVFRASTPLSGKLHVLIVEDNKINQKILEKMLSDTGYTYKTTNDGLEALTAFDQSSFDVILMDIQMPNMDGLTATREIRVREQNTMRKRTPIFAITANALERDRSDGSSSGIDFYFTKPFNKNEILEKIASLEVPQHTTKPAVI